MATSNSTPIYTNLTDADLNFRLVIIVGTKTNKVKHVLVDVDTDDRQGCRVALRLRIQRCFSRRSPLAVMG
jgi:hypothetical protein